MNPRESESWETSGMNHRAIMCVVSVVCERWHLKPYTVHKHKSLLKGIDEILTGLVEDLKARPDRGQYSHAIGEIEIAQNQAEEGWTGRISLDEAFRTINDCLARALPMPEDNE